MTENEIIKALECCTNPRVNEKCPRSKFVDICNDGCIHLLMKQALDLINRQKAEIERLQEEINQMSDACEMCGREYTEDVFGVLKEFVKKFREKADTIVLMKEGIIELHINIDDFDDLVKEMGGD